MYLPIDKIFATLHDQENLKSYIPYALAGLIGWKVVSVIYWKWRARKNKRKGDDARIARNSRWTFSDQERIFGQIDDDLARRYSDMDVTALRQALLKG